MVFIIIFWIIIYSLSSAFSISLLGDRSLISGNLFQFQNIVHLIFNWKFILAMSLAVVARLSFIMINNALLKIPKLANVSTSVCTFITLLSLVFILVGNYIFLDEKLNFQQCVGACIVLAGISLMVK
jgi:drug/metabolite transporter (DMT)-like permease